MAYQRAYHTHKDTSVFRETENQRDFHKEIITWQNEMLAYRDEKKKPYSQTYLQNAAQSVVRHFQSRCPLL